MQTRKWYSLADKVWDPCNLAKAAAAVVANGGAPGIDHISCDRFAEQLETRLDELGQALRAHQFHPLAVQRVYIPQTGHEETEALRDSCCPRQSGPTGHPAGNGTDLGADL